MKNRTLKGIAIAGLCMAICGHAENCKETVLYDGSGANGRMEETGRTFPEAPEWNANWGNLDNMNPPYIRLSGQKGAKADWTGNLVFDKLPLRLNGGSLKITARATQNVKFGIWLTGNSGSGNVAFYNLQANSTKAIEVPVASLLGTGDVTASKVGIGLFGVPAYQYTTLFIDNVKFTCAAGNAGSGSGATSADTDGENTPYYFRDVVPNSPAREFSGDPLAAPAGAYTAGERSALRQKTQSLFVLGEQEHRQIVRFQESKALTAKQSRDGWYNSMFLVERNRLKDSVIASPKNLFLEAGEIAAASGNRSIPLLVADLDYAIKYFTDSTLVNYRLQDYHLLLAGLPVTEVRTSKVKIAYDPFFAATTRNTLPSVEICAAGKCNAVQPGSETEIEFATAGLQEITVKMRSGNLNVNQTLKLEVK